MNFSFYDQLQGVILVTDAKLSIKYYNHFSSTFFKLPPRKLNKIEKLTDLFFTHQFDCQKAVEECLKLQVVQIGPETEIKAIESGNAFTVILKFIPMDATHVAIQIVDFSIEKQLFEKYKEQIKELKQTHEQIVSQDKLRALGELTATLGHEISNPLTVLMSRLEFLDELANLLSHAELLELTQDLKNCALKIKKNVSNVQSFVHGKEDVLSVVELKTVAMSAIKLVENLQICPNLKIVLDIKETPAWIMADALKLEQVLVNLLKNAADALRSSQVSTPEIEVKWELEEYGRILTITDNGPGVSSDIKNNIFDMFFTTKPAGEGTGLGLGISQKIIQSFQGSLFLDDDYKKGAKFVITLPRLELASFTATNLYLLGEIDIESPKLLIVGPDHQQVDDAYKILKKLNYVCVVTNDQKNINEICEFYNIDLILCLDCSVDSKTKIKSVVINKSITQEILISTLGQYLPRRGQ